jgi:hypothetical protein
MECVVAVSKLTDTSDGFILLRRPSSHVPARRRPRAGTHTASAMKPTDPLSAMQRGRGTRAAEIEDDSELRAMTVSVGRISARRLSSEVLWWKSKIKVK